MLPDGLTIEEILPHRGGMLLIDEVVVADGDQAVTRSTVSPRWPLTDDHGVQALVLIELAAQTAGINNGLQYRQTHGPGSGHMGWIAGIKSADFHMDQIPMGSQIQVTSKNEFTFEGFREIKATAAIQDRTIAEITLQLVQAEPEEADG